MQTPLPPHPGAVPPPRVPRASRHGRWHGVLAAVLLAGSSGMALAHTRGAVEPPPSAPATSSSAGDTTSIREVLEDARAPADARASAAVALGRSLGFDAIPTLIARLTDREERVREAVAVTLGRLGGQQARQALEDRLPLEEQPLVREALQRGLTLAEP